MKVTELLNNDFKMLTEVNHEEIEIKDVYICDMLSWVIANINPDSLWITILSHINIIAVAVLKEIKVIVIPDGAPVDVNVIEKANEEGIIILSSKLSAYNISKVCCKAGI